MYFCQDQKSVSILYMFGAKSKLRGLVQIQFYKQAMELSKQEMELFLLIRDLESEKLL